jgi:hypothetical protein
VVCRRTGDYGVPDDGLIRAQGAVRCAGVGPCRGDVHEDLLGVPVEQRREVGRERELNRGVLFLLRGVVVWAATGSGEYRVLAGSSAV